MVFKNIPEFFVIETWPLRVKEVFEREKIADSSPGGASAPASPKTTANHTKYSKKKKE